VTIPVDPIAVALAVTRALDALGIIHTIGGSIASSIAGEQRRGTLRAVRERSSTNLIHQATQLKIDLFVAGGTPLDEQQLRRRQAVEIAPGRTLHVHPPEDILLQKLRWYRKGGETSERQWRDILGNPCFTASPSDVGRRSCWQS
jgi:hypothetical protein